jgi:hypothetical protein
VNKNSGFRFSGSAVVLGFFFNANSMLSFIKVIVRICLDFVEIMIAR